MSRILLIDRSRRREFNGGVIKKIGSFLTATTLFLALNIVALNIVNFSSLHDEGRLDDTLHQFHLIELVNALRMVVLSWSILAFFDIVIIVWRELIGGNMDGQ